MLVTDDRLKIKFESNVNVLIFRTDKKNKKYKMAGCALSLFN